MKALESLKCFKPVFSCLLIENLYFASWGSLAWKQMLSTSGGWFIKLNSELVSPDPGPPIINILYE